ncbi:LysR family transcriptional regulator [Jiella sp. MQZ9-1]|uniref:LysR family transcriptional regulator n=1 Tax=Jiella flava TaxID=2816857 RepID=A0A939G144_9HYPH|nr:LysR family transcriptional regulator [Jiella flava]MBO0663119.1 LysR family transcriptional regulator [Jiella flava]MCD2471538.1 LysR family transcriptional regulator [Jiella flava]
MSISFKQIRYFVAAAETGRISRAAVELNVSQSAVTTAIQQLEALVGAPLLERTPQGVKVTIEGGRFLPQAKQILSSVAEAIRSPHMRGDRLVGRVRVGVTYTVAGYFLPPHLIRFYANFPGISLELFEAPRPVLEQAIIDDAIDIAVMLVSNLENRDQITSEILQRSSRRLWLTPSHPLTRIDRVGLADIQPFPYLMLTVDEAKITAMRYWASANMEPKVLFRTASVEAVRSMVAAGAGVTILSDLVYRPWSLDGQRIETRVIDEGVPSMDVGLAWKRHDAVDPACAAFRDFMRYATGTVGVDPS